jgi:hypothetical protein
MITATGTFLSVEAGVLDVLGWEPDDLIGKDLDAFCVMSSTGENGRDALSEGLAKASERNDGGFQAVSLTLQGKGNCVTDVVLVLFSSLVQQGSSLPVGPTLCPLVFQIKLAALSPGTRIDPLIHSLDSDVFEQLETTRGTSWQYELQQLKFANQRLSQEIHDLEQQQLADAARRTTPAYQHYPQFEAGPSAKYPRQYLGSKRSWDGSDGPGRTS